MIGWKQKVKWKGYGRMWPQPNLRHCPSRHWRNPRKTVRYSVSRFRFETVSSGCKSEAAYSHIVHCPDWICFTTVLLSGVVEGINRPECEHDHSFRCRIHGAFPLLHQYTSIADTGEILTVLSIGRTEFLLYVCVESKDAEFVKQRTGTWCQLLSKKGRIAFC
jgi:hypothetical protein